MSTITPEQIDALLPQTQCGLCGYGACMPYAEAIQFEQAPLNLCPPGGVKTLKALGELLQQNVTSYIAEMEKKEKPAVVALIRESECIGCTLCIKACPVDAILGSAKKMHTVITDECTGCELCIPACPVDCIDLMETSEQDKSSIARERFNAREQRLAREKREKATLQKNITRVAKVNYVEAAIQRVKAKKS